MIYRTVLSDIINDISSQYLLTDREFLALLTKLVSTLWYTGSSSTDIQSILCLIEKSYDCGGRALASTLLKGWSNVTRSVLSLESFDTSTVGYCKSVANCRFALRKQGASPTEIDTIIARYDGICGIPPILLLKPYWRVLLPDPDYSVYRRVIPLSNLGRASPSADLAKCRESEIKFYETTMEIHPVTFNFEKIGYEYGQLCMSASSNSRISLNSHSSFDYSREQGGKNMNFFNEVVNEFLLRTIDSFIPHRPMADLYDSLGNVVVYRDQWRQGSPIAEICYTSSGSSETGVDGRLGFFGLWWAIESLAAEFPQCLVSDSPYIAIGYTPPKLQFCGSIPSRVCTLAEEGFKARVITIVKLSVAIIQSVARFFMDRSMRTDPLVRIGLLSKVKLYDFLVAINSGVRNGIVDFCRPSVTFHCATSADLTTATDTPPREHTSSLLRGFSSSISNDGNRGFLQFACQLATSRRDFTSGLCPPGHLHRNGIMMGEGLSGTFLNVTSGIVRCVLNDFMNEFDWYGGNSVDDAKTFVLDHSELIQAFLDSVRIDSFHEYSTQSGDDLIFFSFHNCSEVRRFLVLLYVVFGLKPSSNTFYSNGHYCTFTEEAAVRTPSSHGWTFVDCIKPRLFDFTSPDGVSSILSHISQISGSVKYLDDDEITERACDIVDTMIMFNRVINERIDRYHLVPGFPSSLGGLDHPCRYLDGTEWTVPEVDRAMVMGLLHCTDEELFDVKYSWVVDDLPDDEDAKEIRSILKYVFNVFRSLPDGSMEDPCIQELHKYPEEGFCPRDLYHSYNSRREELANVKSDLGLASLDDIVSYVTSGLRMKFMFEEPSSAGDVNPLIKLRHRREFLISRTQDVAGDPHTFMWRHVSHLDWRLKSSFQGKVVHRDSFLELVELDDLPSLSVSILGFPGRGYD